MAEAAEGNRRDHNVSECRPFVYVKGTSSDRTRQYETIKRSKSILEGQTQSTLYINLQVVRIRASVHIYVSARIRVPAVSMPRSVSVPQPVSMPWTVSVSQPVSMPQSLEALASYYINLEIV
jgi:hypothetical protein